MSSPFNNGLEPNPKVEPKYQKPDPTELAGDILFVQGACATLSGLVTTLTEEDQREMDAIIALDALPAKAILMGAYTGLVGHEVIFQSWTKTRNAIDFLARHALSVMAEIMDGRKIPAQQMRVCEKIIEWSGLPKAPAIAGSDADKFDQMAVADVGKLTDKELHRKVMNALGKKD